MLPVFLALYEFILNISNDMYIPALPVVSIFFNVETSLAKATIIIWFVGATVSQLFVGPISDKYGRRPILFIGGGIFIVVTFFCAITSSYWVFMVSRFFQGIAVSSLIIAGYAIIHEYYNDQESTKIFAFLGAVTVTAPMLGPTIGGILISFIQWNKLFLILSLASSVILLILWFITPETMINSSTRDSKFTIQDFYFPFIKLIKNKSFFLNSLIAGISYSITISWIINSSFLFTKKYNFSSIQYGNIQILIFGSYLLSMQILKILVNRYQKDYLVTLGIYILFSSSLILFISYFIFNSGWKIMLLCVSINSFGSGILYGPITKIIINVSLEKAGVTIAVFDLIMLFLGSTIGGINSFLAEEEGLFVITTFSLSLVAFITNYLKNNYYKITKH
jgi:Bcr/CflA subfamily drug resistance transporter